MRFQVSGRLEPLESFSFVFGSGDECCALGICCTERVSSSQHYAICRDNETLVSIGNEGENGAWRVLRITEKSRETRRRNVAL
ncbi:hypothetical protein LINPERPRIM_LOCUS7125 [Linum perenne]